MKIAIIGGTFGTVVSKKSGVITQLVNEMGSTNSLIVNGGTIEELNNIDLKGCNLILWMPNVNNETPKNYPKKDRGAVMVVSKVLHDDRTEVDAVSRIFMMHGNAVIVIQKVRDKFSFKLIDALGNVWVETTDLTKLTDGIIDFYNWTKGSTRISTESIKPQFLDRFVWLNKIVADKFEKVKGRYFGNASTRCSAMFPATRASNTHIYVSRRNVSKQRLTVDDMVLAFFNEHGTVSYIGDNKPSVDTPIQLSLFEMFKNVNYIIHGHTYISGAEFTEEYYPCGDMREFDEVKLFIDYHGTGVLNLKNHGFLIYAKTIGDLEEIVDGLVFEERMVGFEKIEQNG